MAESKLRTTSIDFAENGACFYQHPFLSGKFTLKILILQTYLMWGDEVKTLTVFSTLAKNSVKFFSQNRFTSAFSLLFATAPTTTATAATRPLKRKKAARFLLPSDVNKLASIFANPGSYNSFQRACALLRRCRV